MTTPAKQTLREFEKAFRDLLGQDTDPMPDIKQAFTAGARWTAERIVKVAKEFDDKSYCMECTDSRRILAEFLKLAKELE